jgi:hypothetical protein
MPSLARRRNSLNILISFNSAEMFHLLQLLNEKALPSDMFTK